ncbi:DUF421 domain-containing protein [Paracoccus sp. MA]|uniref:DUF421 domain-containing protein n=1 Tax=unclassified Paracoccus (in: a-proteobacteria) TaxID=2688777 RepID=UPI00048DDB07|nr:MULTISPECIES: YetF domain-containing protein [unclassified Paracoccus (in: a-proteobacteria)]RQP04555.1 MAG: DUF421 domain-containing protein [Paracoccus sp. BP8]UFM64454.1 DUF421 domain-containing protein [Paracoccus sp. MA]
MDSVIRGIAIYLVLLAMTRLSGRRTLAQTTPFDFVLLLIIAETTQQALLGDDFSIVNAVVLMITLVTVDVILSFAKMRSARLALWLDGTPTVLMSRGEIDREALTRARVSPADILEAARVQHGLATLREIDAAVLEISGAISIIPRK